MRVLFVLLSFTKDSPAGIERSVWNLVLALRELGHDASILTCATSESDACVVSVALPMNFPATENDLVQGMTPDRVGTVREAITNFDPELVCWTDASWGLAWLRDEVWWGPSIAMMHVPRTDRLGLDAYRGLPLLVPSDFVRRNVSHLGLDLHVLHNAVAVPATGPASFRLVVPQGLPIRSLSRAAFGKGIEEAIRSRPQGAPPYEVAIASAPFEIVTAEQETVQRSVHNAVAEAPNVALLSPVRWSAEGAFLDNAALLLVTSILPETFGMGAVEAQCRGCPVVAFDVGAHREILADSALLVNPEQGFRGLWGSVIALMSSTDRYHELSLRGLDNAQRFQPDVIARQFAEGFLHVGNS